MMGRVHAVVGLWLAFAAVCLAQPGMMFLPIDHCFAPLIAYLWSFGEPIGRLCAAAAEHKVARLTRKTHRNRLGATRQSDETP